MFSHSCVIPKKENTARNCKGRTVSLSVGQGCISCGTCSYLELTEDHVLTSAYVKIFRTVTRNAVRVFEGKKIVLDEP